MSVGYCERCQQTRPITQTSVPAHLDESGRPVGRAMRYRFDVHPNVKNTAVCMSSGSLI
mgnify:CR=1 FL=1